MRPLWWILIGVAVVVLGGGGYWYHVHSVRYPSTDDAYVKANVVQVAPQVSGRVVSVPISDQQFVHKGELLFKIDQRSFKLNVEQAAANLALTHQSVNAMQAGVQAARAQLSSDQAQLANARLHDQRMHRLYTQHSVSKSQVDDADARLKSARAAVSLARAKREQAKQQLGTVGQRNERLRKAEAKLKQADLDLSHTVITAPCNGRVSNVSLQAGNMVQAGNPQFALVCNDKFWVYANFKETDLDRVRPGQKATISVDMYPGHTFHGVVQNIGAASGAAFSLLPPENATGNWVKVTQRVPVRILITDPNPRYPLRVQTSTEVTIHTGAGSTPKGHSFASLPDAPSYGSGVLNNPVPGAGSSVAGSGKLAGGGSAQ